MPSSMWRVKGRSYLTLGVLLLLAFALGIIIAVSYLYGYPYYEPSNFPVITAVCVPTALVPGIVLILLGRRASLRERELIEFTAWVKTYRRIRLADLAAKLGKPQFESEKILVTVIDRGLVKGFIDRNTDEFVIHEAVGQEHVIETCPRCGPTSRNGSCWGKQSRARTTSPSSRPRRRGIPRLRDRVADMDGRLRFSAG